MQNRTTDTLTVTSNDRHTLTQTDIKDGQKNKKADRFAFLIIFTNTHLAHLQGHTDRPTPQTLQKSQIPYPQFLDFH